jgi:hypothetical protein
LAQMGTIALFTGFISLGMQCAIISVLYQAGTYLKFDIRFLE